MGKIKIYLAGGMSGLSYDEQIQWRRDFVANLMECLGGRANFEVTIPPYYYTTAYPEAQVQDSEREAMEFLLNRLRHSDLVVVNFNVPQSIGTAMEIAIAKELRIPVIGIKSENIELHPWLTESCIKMFNDASWAAEHVRDYYLS